ncbi:prenyltransferase [Nocardioides sp. B-3]|uniref:prenyltransferase n=1 Tax=Nocardioides sp. B-3 TaxID=2895565 RepID=UPI002152769A|nr:prenyltransferase [Nocardioides sp. B-3]UUZ59320.1 prenyltransferase [Nocardioides sp. B-3]
MRPDVILTAARVEETAASIAAMQEPSGAIPWTIGEHTDIWNHVESAMALLVGGRVEAAGRAYDWAVSMQRADGSWPMKIVAGEIEDHSGETNMSAYLAVGVWHHWLIRRDEEFVRRLWTTVRRGLDWVVSMQLPFGGIAWSQEWAAGSPAKVNADALLAGSSSIYQSLRAGVALADLMDDPAAGVGAHRWPARPRAARAPRPVPGQVRVLDGLVLPGPRRSRPWRPAARELIDSRWDTFVEAGLGIRCVSRNPWVTGAETCELVMALDAIGDRQRAVQLLADMQHLRAEQGKYWTGYVFPDDVNWPAEHTTYTAAAVIPAVDALTHTSAGADIMRGTTLAADFAEIALECGCPSGDRVSSLS